MIAELCLCVLTGRTLRQSGSVGCQGRQCGVPGLAVCCGATADCAAPGSSYSIDQLLKQQKKRIEHVFENTNLMLDPKNEGLLLITDLEVHTAFSPVPEDLQENSPTCGGPVSLLTLLVCQRMGISAGEHRELSLSLLLWLLSS